jgi:hypothetical protein
VKHVTSDNARNLQSVTITLPREVILEAKHEAVDEGLSLSAFVAKILEERLEKATTYRRAMEREKKAMREGVGSIMGEVTWTRDELHER